MPWREDIGAAPPLPDDPGQEDGNGREEEQLGAVQAGPDGLLAAGELDAEPEDAVCREVDDKGLAGVEVLAEVLDQDVLVVDVGGATTDVYSAVTVRS